MTLLETRSCRMRWMIAFAISTACGPSFASSPFVPPTAIAPAQPAPARLGSFELSGILLVGSEVQVCLFDAATSKAGWWNVGEERGGVLVESFDAESETALVRSGSEQRLIRLRQARIVDQGFARLEDGSIDWFHMKLSDKQKESEAQLLMWDILEVGRQARLGRSAASRAPPGK